MGALFKNVCYPDQTAARAQACSSFDSKVMATTNLYTSECTSTVFTGATMSICKRTNGGACTNVTPPWPVTPACDHDGGYTLSVDYFWAFLGVIVIVWGAKKLLGIFENDHAGQS